MFFKSFLTILFLVESDEPGKKLTILTHANRCEPQSHGVTLVINQFTERFPCRNEPVKAPITPQDRICVTVVLGCNHLSSGRKSYFLRPRVSSATVNARPNRSAFPRAPLIGGNRFKAVGYPAAARGLSQPLGFHITADLRPTASSPINGFDVRSTQRVLNCLGIGKSLSVLSIPYELNFSSRFIHSTPISPRA